MSIKLYNKLVRDYIPDIIRGDGQIPHTRILEDDEEYAQELLKKMVEEAEEISKAKTKRNLITEIADTEQAIFDARAHMGTVPQVLEAEKVAAAARTQANLSKGVVEAERLKRFKKRGGFGGRVFLISIETPGK